jgi:hypothetical protein
VNQSEDTTRKDFTLICNQSNIQYTKFNILLFFLSKNDSLLREMRGKNNVHFEYHEDIIIAN